MFQGNSVNESGSNLTITGNSLAVTNVTTFDENEASLEGGALTGWAIQNICYRCKLQFS